MIIIGLKFGRNDLKIQASFISLDYDTKSSSIKK